MLNNDVTVGDVYGGWKVIERSAKKNISGIVFWSCACIDCARIQDVTSTKLRSRKSSCGCARKLENRINIGEVYGDLEIIARPILGKDGRGKSKTFVLCRCKCGREKSFCASQVLTGRVTHCYRCRDLSYLRKEDSMLNEIFGSYRRTAAARGYNFDLDKEQVRDLISRDCYYCGVGLSNYITNGFSSLAYNGIDRLDNTQGYDLTNCVTCCILCNKAKGAQTLSSFVDWIERLRANFPIDEIKELILAGE